MADDVTKNINFNVDTKPLEDAKTNVEELNKEVENLGATTEQTCNTTFTSVEKTSSKWEIYKTKTQEVTKSVTKFVTGNGKLDQSFKGLQASLSTISPTLGNTAKGIGAMTKAALTFISTPIGAIIAALALALKAVNAALKRSDNAMTEMQKAIAPVQALFEKLANLLTSVLEPILVRLAKTIKVVTTGLAKLFGVTNSQIEATQEAAQEAADDVEDAERRVNAINEDYKKQQEAIVKANQDYAKQIDNAREQNEKELKASQATLASISKTTIQGYQALKDAAYQAYEAERAMWEGLLENETDQTLIDIYQTKLDIATQTYKNTLQTIEDSADKANKSLADATAKVVEDIKKQEHEAALASAESEEERLKIQREYILQQAAEREQSLNKEMQERLENAKNTGENENAIVAYYEAEKQKLLNDTTAKIIENNNAVTANLDEQAQKQQKNAEKTAKDYQSAMQSVNNSVKQYTQLVADYYANQVQSIISGKEELTAAEKEEALTAVERQYHAEMATLILDQATGIANAVAGSMTLLKSPGGIPGVIMMAATLASSVASVISGVMQAKQIAEGYKEQKAQIQAMATGGLVQGAGTATSDSIPARLSNGESVLTARATAAHYDTLSRWNVEGGGRPFPNALPLPQYHFAQGGVAQAMDVNTMSAVVTQAVSQVQPVVDVREITLKQNRVAVKEQSLRS